MENVTERTSNPFDMRPPCRDAGGDPVPAVHGYGDANADFHLIGDYPARHGGERTGVPFTDSVAGERLQSVFHEADFLNAAYDDEPVATNLFMSYVHSCPTPDGRPPTPTEYAELERFFDAELRGISAHVLLPVGERATEHVLAEYTARSHKIDLDMPTLHATQIRGRGFLVVPIREPAEWAEGDREALVEALRSIRGSDYRQTADLGRFVADDRPYWVR